MFSIIIPLYNKAPYIEKAIQSVLAQTFQEFELIVIDDGSKDNGFDVVKQLFSFLTPPLGGWGAYQQQNSGVSTTRNNGVKLAKYDYIAFLDADDWWEPGYLEGMKELIEEFPEAGIYGSSYYKVKNGINIPANIGVEKGFAQGEINYFRVYANTFYMPLWTGATVIKKTVFLSENGFKPNLKVGEDFDLWARVALKYPVAFLNKVLAYYNQDVEVVSSGSRMKNYIPDEHMLFCDYSYIKDPDFIHLYQLLAVYGLLPNYVNNHNIEKVNKILSDIDWKSIPFKYTIYYIVLPKCVLKIWLKFIDILYVCKTKLLKK